VIGNETEAISYAQSHDLKTENIEEIAIAMAKLPKANNKRQRVVIITQGTDPTIVASATEGGKVDVKTFPVHKIDESQINDTNGAGYVHSPP
jgi:adenosine kinase